jgi:hypothetical protein
VLVVPAVVVPPGGPNKSQLLPPFAGVKATVYVSCSPAATLVLETLTVQNAGFAPWQFTPWAEFAPCCAVNATAVGVTTSSGVLLT